MKIKQQHVFYANLALLALILATWIVPKTQSQPSRYYQVVAVNPGEVGVRCLNGGDATIRPQDEFGYIVVSCGTK